MCFECEHAGGGFQRGWGTGEAVGGDAPGYGGGGDPEGVEARGGEPVADLRDQVRLMAAAGPDDGAAVGAQLGAVADGTPDVLVRYVAEDAAGEDQVGRGHPGVLAGEGGVARDHLDPRQGRGPRRLAGGAGVARVK